MKLIRRVLTVVMSPVWVPVSVAGGLVWAPVQAVKKSIKNAKKDGTAKGVVKLPINMIRSVVTSPVDAVEKVGEAMWGKVKRGEYAVAFIAANSESISLGPRAKRHWDGVSLVGRCWPYFTGSLDQTA